MNTTPSDKRLLLTRTDHDIGNHYMHAYSEEILKTAEVSGWIVEKAENEEDNRKNVHSRLKNKPSLIVFNGHGSDSEVCGFRNETILGANDSKLLKNTVSYIRACSALNILGKSAIENGAKAVTGYRGEFWIPRVNEYNSRPLQDPSARPVLESSNAIPIKLLKGANAKEAIEASQGKAYDFIMKMLATEEPYDSAALQALITNSQNLGCEENRS